MITYASDDSLTVDEYVEFLSRSDLGSEYPRKNFRERIGTLLKNADVRITARDDAGALVGVCLAITDFAYFLFLTDLGVDRDWTGRGIGRSLVQRAHEKAGGEADVCMITWANKGVLPFYTSCGMEEVPCVVAKHATEWELFEVGRPAGP